MENTPSSESSSVSELPWLSAGRAAGDLGKAVPEGFGGILINQTAQSVEIYAVKGFDALATQLLDVASPYGKVIWVDRPYTTLIATRDRIGRDVEWIQSIGLNPVGWGPDVPSNCVFIEVPTYTAEQDRAVKSRFGSWVKLRPGFSKLTSI